mmetsp:Transcript_19340/g.40270  ORF Transcript_19340/g.40270 Transcript_19340/m.40270 type:complete len:236 (+) Transcript_19340:269-976(+)
MPWQASPCTLPRGPRGMSSATLEAELLQSCKLLVICLHRLRNGRGTGHVLQVVLFQNHDHGRIVDRYEGLRRWLTTSRLELHLLFNGGPQCPQVLDGRRDGAGLRAYLRLRDRGPRLPRPPPLACSALGVVGRAGGLACGRGQVGPAVCGRLPSAGLAVSTPCRPCCGRCCPGTGLLHRLPLARLQGPLLSVLDRVQGAGRLGQGDVHRQDGKIHLHARARNWRERRCVACPAAR